MWFIKFYNILKENKDLREEIISLKIQKNTLNQKLQTLASRERKEEITKFNNDNNGKQKRNRRKSR
tara:strand:- start:506 stop:703 length:198 start_codon:yes stop_codon:yes gene_type:complete